MFYIFHGEDELAISEQVAEFKAKVGDPSVRDLNTSVFEGRKLNLAELKHACDAIPFLADKRLVIVNDWLSGLGGRSGHKKEDGKAEPAAVSKAILADLLTYLPRMPESTRLIFVETRRLPASHPVLKLAMAADERSVREFGLPQAGGLAHWIVKRAGRYNGQMESGAAALLAEFSSGDLRALDQDIQKLLAYINWSRPAAADDVRLLVHDVHQGNVFAMVDALAQGDGQTAIRQLHRLLDGGEAALSLLGMIVRQFRLMILLKELAEEPITGDEAARQLKLHPFVAKKLGSQAQAFSLRQLEDIYRRLQAMDVDIKRGQADDVTALDMLVAGLTSTGR